MTEPVQKTAHLCLDFSHTCHSISATPATLLQRFTDQSTTHALQLLLADTLMISLALLTSGRVRALSGGRLHPHLPGRPCHLWPLACGRCAAIRGRQAGELLLSVHMGAPLSVHTDAPLVEDSRLLGLVSRPLANCWQPL